MDITLHCFFLRLVVSGQLNIRQLNDTVSMSADPPQTVEQTIPVNAAITEYDILQARSDLIRFCVDFYLYPDPPGTLPWGPRQSLGRFAAEVSLQSFRWRGFAGDISLEMFLYRWFSTDISL
jgi:hypothetical protein